jgi:hypothetical protein
MMNKKAPRNVTINFEIIPIGITIKVSPVNSNSSNNTKTYHFLHSNLDCARVFKHQC